MIRRLGGSALPALALLTCLALPSGALAAEHIRLFRTDVQLHADGSFEVEERISYDFGTARKHGIHRDIPVAYGRGMQADYRIALDVERVRDGAGVDLPYRISREGRLRRIRIGDPDRTVTGLREYRIVYRVRRGILWLEEHDELYWNATGNEWGVPIRRAEVTVRTPTDRPAGEIRALCFTGRQGSVETDCLHESEARMTYFEATRRLAAREGLTVVLALPKDLLDEPSDLRKLLDRASDFVSWAIALPFLVFFAMYAHWRRVGRDPRGAAAVPVRYEPPEAMTPAEVGVVRDQHANTIDITASLLDLAVRGVIRIEEVESSAFLFLSRTDYVFHRLKDDTAGLKDFEKRILSALFGSADRVKLSSLKNEFYASLPGIEDALYDEVSREGRWFPARPDRVRRRYAGLSVAIALPLALLAFGMGNAGLLLSVGLSGAIALAFSVFMPRRTRKGRRAELEIRGFQEFVERVEADRLERLGMRDIAHFESLLPYAFVLGVADPWAEAFADLYTAPPAWFTSRDGGSFEAHRLVDRVGRAMDTAGSTMTSQPSSSGGGSGSSGFGGGGFSGGGFGGGGGGSW